MRALSIAATGMLAQQTNVEVIANNLANMNTTAFKEQRAEFTDLQSQPDMAELDPSSGKMPKGKRVSGSISWTCGTVGRIDPHMNDAVNGMFKKLIPPK